ncbi:MAG: tetratricopeptide repeat protein [Candidatus Wallbacteria bacterium]
MQFKLRLAGIFNLIILIAIIYATLWFFMAWSSSFFNLSTAQQAEINLEINGDFFSAAVKKYNLENQSEINKIAKLFLTLKNEYTQPDKSLTSPAIISDSFFYSGKNNFNKEQNFLLVELSKEITKGGSLYNIIGERAAVYLTRPEITPANIARSVYLIKKNGEWKIDGEFTAATTLLSGKSDAYENMAATAVEIETNWFLSQYEQFGNIIKQFKEPYLLTANEPYAAEIIKKAAHTEANPALLYYAALCFQKRIKFKNAHELISKANDIMPDNIFIESLHCQIIMYRKFSRLITAKPVKLLEKAPYFTPLLLCAGSIFNSNLNYGLSEKMYKTALVMHPSIGAYFHSNYALTCEKLKKYETAAYHYKIAAESGGSYNHYLAGKAYLAAENHEKAAAEFERCFDGLLSNPKKIETAQYLADHYLSKGDNEKYYDYKLCYYIALANSPAAIFTFITLLILFFTRKYLVKKALLTTYRHICKISMKPGFQYNAFDFYCENNNSGLAITLFSDYMDRLKKDKRDEEYIIAAIKLANHYLKLYKIDEAASLFKEALHMNPDCDSAILGLGMCEFELKNYEIAAEYFKSGIDINPEVCNFFYYLGLCQLVLNKSDDGINNIMNSYKVDNTFEPALTITQNYLISANKTKELVKFFDDIMIIGNLTEQFYDRYLRLNISLMDEGRLKKALEYCAVKNFKSADTFLSIGCAYREIGQYEKSEENIRKSIAISSGQSSDNNPAIRLFYGIKNSISVPRGQIIANQYLELGITQKISGNNEAAVKSFIKSKKAAPSFPYVYYFLKEYEKSCQMMPGQIKDSEMPWNNASTIEAIYLSLTAARPNDKSSVNNEHKKNYRNWANFYLEAMPDGFGIFSYKYLKHIPKEKYLAIINDSDYLPAV